MIKYFCNICGKEKALFELSDCTMPIIVEENIMSNGKILGTLATYTSTEKIQICSKCAKIIGKLNQIVPYITDEDISAITDLKVFSRNPVSFS